MCRSEQHFKHLIEYTGKWLHLWFCSVCAFNYFCQQHIHNCVLSCDWLLTSRIVSQYTDAVAASCDFVLHVK